MQFSLFGTEASSPGLVDLDGLLLAGGQWVRGPGGARISVVVADAWRAEALEALFTELGVGGAPPAQAPVGRAVRTTFDTRLDAAAARWSRGANQAPPADFVLTAGGLRLWVLAAGRRDAHGYTLGTPDEDGVIHRVAGAGLSRLGLAAVSVTGRGGGPGWRLTSAKRLRRLAELIGPAPSGGSSDWPVEGA